jgi:hypothetical protein
LYLQFPDTFLRSRNSVDSNFIKSTKIHFIDTVHNERWDHGSCGWSIIRNGAHLTFFMCQGGVPHWDTRQRHMLLTFRVTRCPTVQAFHHHSPKLNPATTATTYDIKYITICDIKNVF